MKVLLISLAVLSFTSLCYGFSQPIIRDTQKEDCIDGRCGLLCSWDGAKLFPGDTLNQIGKCNLLYCRPNFDIVITPCPFDMTGQTEYVDRDDSKPYPECCGRQVPRRRH